MRLGPTNKKCSYVRSITLASVNLAEVHGAQSCCCGRRCDCAEIRIAAFLCHKTHKFITVCLHKKCIATPACNTLNLFEMHWMQNQTSMWIVSCVKHDQHPNNWSTNAFFSPCFTSLGKIYVKNCGFSEVHWCCNCKNKDRQPLLIVSFTSA